MKIIHVVTVVTACLCALPLAAADKHDDYEPRHDGNRRDGLR